MAKYTVADIRQLVQRQFGDEAQVQLENNDILRWINMAQREAVLQTEGLLEGTLSGDFVANSQTYMLSSDLFVLHRVRVRESVGSPYHFIPWMNGVDFERFVDGWDGATDRGTPQVWTEKARTIIFFPIPQVSLIGGFKYEGSMEPSDVVNDADTHALPEYYNNYIVDYCLMRAYEMDEDLDAQLVKAQVVQATLEFNEGRENQFGRDKYPVVLDIPADWDY